MCWWDMCIVEALINLSSVSLYLFASSSMFLLKVAEVDEKSIHGTTLFLTLDCTFFNVYKFSIDSCITEVED